MNRIELTWTGQALARITPEHGRRLADSEVVYARPSPYQAELWEITPRAKMDVALVGDVEVWGGTG